MNNFTNASNMDSKGTFKVIEQPSVIVGGGVTKKSEALHKLE